MRVEWNCRLESCTPLTLFNVLEEISVLGTHYNRLQAIAGYFSKNPSKCGRICQAFGLSIISYLHSHNASMLLLVDALTTSYVSDSTLSLLNLMSSLQGYIHIINKLSYLCFTHLDYDKRESDVYARDNVSFLVSHAVSQCPTGLDLIDRIYNFTYEECSVHMPSNDESSCNIGSIFLYMLQKSLRPFLNIGYLWCQKGQFAIEDDLYSEFCIGIHKDGI